MDVVTSAISNVITTGIPHAAQEARRDSLTKETIPQINQNSASQGNNPSSQGNVANAPSSSNLFIQADAIINTGQTKIGEKKSLQKDKKTERTSEEKEAKGVSSAKGTGVTSTASGNSFNQKVASASNITAALDGAFGNTGVDYSIDADKHREKGKGYSSKAIADRYKSSNPRLVTGNFIDVNS